MFTAEPGVEPKPEPEQPPADPHLAELMELMELTGRTQERERLELLHTLGDVAVGAAGPTSRAQCKRVVLVGGPPLAGKATQCALIVQRYGMVHVSCGDLLREHVRRGTTLGQAAAPQIDRRELVATDIVLAAVTERLARPDVANRGCLLDNFPLTREQAEEMIGQISPEVFIFLDDVPHAQLMARAAGRRIDPETGRTYHLEHNPPPNEVVGRLQQRPDDKDEQLQQRLAMHEISAPPLVACFGGGEPGWGLFPSCRLVSVDASQGQDATFAAIATILDQDTAAQDFHDELGDDSPLTDDRCLFERMENPRPYTFLSQPHAIGPAWEFFDI